MKKIFFTIFLAGMTSMTLSAQDLFQTVYDNAIGVVNKASSSDEQIQINQFKVTVLNYITTQVKKRGLQKDGYFFDNQAVNLQCFVTDFIDYVTKAGAISPAKRAAVIKCYQEASLQNPLFRDTDKERALCYVNDSRSLTPFSVDTDWDKAYTQASEKIKAIMPR